MSKTHLTNTHFNTLQLHPLLLQGLDEGGFIQCTPIQEKTLPLSLEGKDVAGQAQTGTGKTIAFLLATFNTLLNKKRNDNTKAIGALIIAPTRELAIQIYNDAQRIGKHCELNIALAYGGANLEKQKQQLEQGADILIGTPGRIIDFFKQRVFSLKQCDVMVLDEADRMFDLGFIKDIRFLLRRLPPPTQRLNLMFSATLSYRVTELAYEHMNNPQLIRIEPEQITAKKVEESLYYPADNEKTPLLVYLLQKLKPKRSVVFINTKQTADILSRTLDGNGIGNGTLSGDVPQKKRQRILSEFQNGQLDLLIATDVAARGLHIDDVTHVFNYDLPQDCEDYVHRIGRTARSGASGAAISFACENYAYSLPDIEDYISHKIPSQSFNAQDLPALKPPTKRPPKNKSPHHQQKSRRNKPFKTSGEKRKKPT